MTADKTNVAEWNAAELNVADLDPLIRDTVLLLRGGGFRTYSSCQGTKGHGYKLPTVGILCDHGGAAAETRDRLANFLLERGLSGFSIHCEKAYPHPDAASQLESLRVEFWSLSCLPCQPWKSNPAAHEVCVAIEEDMRTRGVVTTAHYEAGAPLIAGAIRAAEVVAERRGAEAEREACALTVRDMPYPIGWVTAEEQHILEMGRWSFVEAIRARGQTKDGRDA